MLQITEIAKNIQAIYEIVLETRVRINEHTKVNSYCAHDLQRGQICPQCGLAGYNAFCKIEKFFE